MSAMLSEIDQMDERNRLADLDHQIRQSKDVKGMLSEEIFFTNTQTKMVSEEKSLPVATEESSSQSDVARLLQRLHHVQADLRSSNLHTNHMKLQLQALTSSEIQVRKERDLLEFAMAECEQDKLLLETRLQEIAGFEGMRLSVSAEDVRGELLHLANNKIQQLLSTLNKQEESKQDLTQKLRELDQAQLDKQALREELDHMGNQLAQRTVLYSAQERRLNDYTRATHSLQDEKNQEVAELRARLQDLERRYEATDRERIETIFRERQTNETSKTVEIELANALEREQQLDSELNAMNTQNLSLHATVEHLRGANFDEIEQDLAADVQIIRAEGNAREEQLKMQLSHAQDLLSQEATRRESVLDEVEDLRRELESKNELLRALKDGQTLPYQETVSASIQSPGAESGVVDSLQFAPQQDDDEITEIASNSNPSPNPDLAEDTDASIYAAMFEEGSPRCPSENANSAFYYNDESPNVVYGTGLSSATLQVLHGLVAELVPSEDCDSANGKSLLDALNSISNSNDGTTKEAESYIRALRERVSQAITTAYNTAPVEVEDSEGGGWMHLSQRLVDVLRVISQQYSTIEYKFHQRMLNESFMLSKSSSVDQSQTVSVSKNFLVGGHEEGGSEAGSATEDDLSTQLADELSCLKDELIKRKRRERQLHLALQQQQQKLQIVLERAASMRGITDASPPIDVSANSAKVSTTEESRKYDETLKERDHTISSLQSERDLLQQKSDGYLEEIEYLQQHAESTRQLGFHEAAEIHSQKICKLEVELSALSSCHEKALAKAAAAAEAAAGTVSGVEHETMKKHLCDLQTELAIAQADLGHMSVENVESHEMLRSDLESRYRAEMSEHKQQLQMEFDSNLRTMEQEHKRELARQTAEHEMEKDTERSIMHTQMQDLMWSLKQERNASEESAHVVSSTSTASNTEDFATSAVAVETKDESMQTMFNISDSQEEQRVEFAAAHHRLQEEEDNKLKHELEVQKLTLERAHQARLHDKIAELHREYETQLVITKQKVSTKYRALLERQRHEFESLKLSLKQVIKVESGDSIGASDANNVLRSSLTGSLKDYTGAVYPEMLSPDTTENIMRKVTSRSNEVSFSETDDEYVTHATAAAVFKELDGAADAVDFSATDISHNSSVTMSPPRWDADLSLASIGTPLIARATKATSTTLLGANAKTQRQPMKDTSPITTGKLNTKEKREGREGGKSRFSELSKPKKSIGALRGFGTVPSGVRSFPMNI